MARAAPIAIEPRLLKLDEAARYLRITQTQLRQLGVGRVHLGARVLYDRHAIDAYLDGLNSLGPQSPALDADDPEAAFDRSFGTVPRSTRAA